MIYSFNNIELNVHISVYMQDNCSSTNCILFTMAIMNLLMIDEEVCPRVHFELHPLAMQNYRMVQVIMYVILIAVRVR